MASIVEYVNYGAEFELIIYTRVIFTFMAQNPCHVVNNESASSNQDPDQDQGMASVGRARKQGNHR